MLICGNCGSNFRRYGRNLANGEYVPTWICTKHQKNRKDCEMKQLKEVNILDYSPDDYYFGVSLTSAGVVNTDLIIVPLDKINESFAAQYCKRIDEMEFKINYDFEFVSYSSINYGIKVYSKDLNISLFEKYITYNEEENEYLEYGLFFNKDSVNLKDLFKQTNSKYSNNATKVFYGLMDEENE